MLFNIEDYLIYCREKEVAQNTLKNYKNSLLQLQNFLQTKKINHIDQITKEHMLDYKDFLKFKNYALSTCNNKIIVINIYFNYLEKENLKLKLFKKQTKEHRESINESDFKRLLRFSDDEMKLFILVIANTGLRISELCSLRKINLNESTVKITNKGKERTIVLVPWLKKSLQKYVENKKDSEFIFNKTQTNYRSRLKTIAGKAKVKKSKVYPHSFRHFFAKQYIANGGDSTILQQLLGHEDISTTTIYTQYDTQQLAQEFKKMRNK